MPSDGSIRFGVFEVDFGARELRKRGVRMKLQDQPFRVLEALLEKPGEIVTREELKERLWAHDEFVEFGKVGDRESRGQGKSGTGYDFLWRLCGGRRRRGVRWAAKVSLGRAFVRKLDPKRTDRPKKAFAAAG